MRRRWAGRWPSALLGVLVVGCRAPAAPPVASNDATPPAGTALVVRPVQLQGGPVQIGVRFDQGHDAWAAYAGEKAAAFLSGAEGYLDMPFATASGRLVRTGPSSGPARVLIAGSERVVRHGVWYGGYNNSTDPGEPGERRARGALQDAALRLGLPGTLHDQHDGRLRRPEPHPPA